MNDDIVVQKILKLLENNTAFIGYALNGGIGIKINVRNTETGKTIQALSINVDSTGEVLVVKDSEDGQFKAVTFKTAEKVSERIIQLRKTKPVDDKKVIEYTDSDIEVFYLFVKLIDTGVPVPSQLKSTWIRKGSSCTQFVGAYERCNYASKETISGTSYTGLPYKEYPTLTDCLNDDTGRDAKTPHGSKDENGAGFGVRIYSTKLTAEAEQNIKNVLESHDNALGTSYKKLFGYGSILECSGAMYIQGWEAAKTSEDVPYFHCDFGYFPGFATDCSSDAEAAGYCTKVGGYINSKTPSQTDPLAININNDWGYEYGWMDLPYDFFYRRHFIPLYVNGAAAQGSFLIITGLNDDQQPIIPEGYFPWIPNCPSGGTGGPYDGSGGNRFPDGVKPPEKRDMKLSTHKAEIWLGSNKKKEALKLYELGASDLFSGMYNAFIIRSEETRKDIEDRLNRGFAPTAEEITQHDIFYKNWNKNRIDLNIDPRVWVYVIDNVPKAVSHHFFDNIHNDPQNQTLHNSIDNLYNRTVNLSIIDKKTQVIHLKLGLTSRSPVSNTDCKGTSSGYRDTNLVRSSQSWEYQQYRTITVEDWKVKSTTNTLDTTKLEAEDTWNLDYIKRKFYTSFGDLEQRLNFRDTYDQILLRHDASIDKEKIITDIHYEQLNYSLKFIVGGQSFYGGNLYLSGLRYVPYKEFYDNSRYYALSSKSWWDLWGKGRYSRKDKRLSSIVGFEKNLHQIVRSYGTGAELNYSGNYISVLGNESYFEYLTENRPQVFIPSIIKTLRADKSASYYNDLDDRQKTLEEIGTLYYFSEIHTRWSEPGSTNTSDLSQFITLPSLYYGYGGYGRETLSSHNSLQSNLQEKNTGLKIMDTRSWIQNLWAQLVYDGFINVDVDSYKDVNFTLPTDPKKYKKFSLFKEGTNTEYPFSTIIHHTDPPLELDTILSAGKLEIANKQVKITKPTNVDLDPNMSFLLYIYPFVEVTKKKKTI